MKNDMRRAPSRQGSGISSNRAASLHDNQPPRRDSRQCLTSDRQLGIEVRQACLAPFVFASHGYESFHLLMPLYLCRRWEGQVTAREHKAMAWVKPNKLTDYPMPPADAPLVAWLRDLV